jgi:hypothetical protein
MTNARPVIPTLVRRRPSVDPCHILLTNDTLLSRLANELARDLYPHKQILACYNITEEQFAESISESPIFMAFYAEARSVWGATTNAPQRVALKAGILFEQWLDEADLILHDPNSPVADKVKLGSYLSRLAGFENVNPPPAKEGGGSGGSGGTATHVTINLGHGRKIDISKQAVDAQQIDAEVLQLEALRASSGDPDAIPAQVTVAMPQQPQPVLNPTAAPTPAGEQRWSVSRGQLNNGVANPGPAPVAPQATK